MRTVKVKICGITSKEDLQMVCALGVDAVGFVMEVPASPRNLSLEKAEKLFRSVPPSVKSVLVTAPQSLEEVLKLYGCLKPDAIQIHGEKVQGFSILREKLPDPFLIKAVNVKSMEALERAVQEAKFFDAILVDSFASGKYGGTGLTHDWSISQLIRDAIHPKPIILAGGLNPENVKEAIRIVKPFAVDVSTGVESKPGVKDPKKVKAFIGNAKEISLNDAFECLRLWGG